MIRNPAASARAVAASNAATIASIPASSSALGTGLLSSNGIALGPMTGERYIASLKDKREVWIDGRRAEDVTTHPAFKDVVGELARVYDLQNSPQYRDEMTCICPETGKRISEV